MLVIGRPHPPTTNTRGLSATESFGQASNAKLLVSDCRDRVAGVRFILSRTCLCKIRRMFSHVAVPYSLDITPPSFISPPFRFARIRCEGIFISNLSPPPPPPPDHGRTLQLRQTRGRLELSVPPYIERSYLLASDTPTKRLATRQQARS